MLQTKELKSIRELLIDLEIRKTKLEKKMEEVEAASKHIQKMFPDTFTYKNKFLFEEKLKAITGMYELSLKFQQELLRTTKDQINLMIKSGEIGGGDNSTRDLAEEVIEMLNTKDVDLGDAIDKLDIIIGEESITDFEEESGLPTSLEKANENIHNTLKMYDVENMRADDEDELKNMQTEKEEILSPKEKLNKQIIESVVTKSKKREFDKKFKNTFL